MTTIEQAIADETERAELAQDDLAQLMRTFLSAQNEALSQRPKLIDMICDELARIEKRKAYLLDALEKLSKPSDATRPVLDAARKRLAEGEGPAPLPSATRAD